MPSIRLAILLLASFGIAWAQQPFYTDDADTTPAGKFHMEISNQYSVLQRLNFPNLRQNATVFQVNYGLTEWLEVGMDSPLLAIFNAAHTVEPRIPVGIGDTNVTAKLKLRHEGKRAPALTLAFAIETPTGDTATSLGSGVADYGVNSVLQKKLSEVWTVRINNGVLFSGNTLTGVVGLAARGVVYFGGTSVTRQVTTKLLLGVEVNGAYTKKDEVGKGTTADPTWRQVRSMESGHSRLRSSGRPLRQQPSIGAADWYLKRLLKYCRSLTCLAYCVLDISLIMSGHVDQAIYV